jgi:hypothetical protein
MKTPEQILEEWKKRIENAFEHGFMGDVVQDLLKILQEVILEERKRCLSILNSACAITECEDYAAVAEEIEKGE